MIYRECDERAHIIDSIENGDFERMDKFIKVGKRIINPEHITMVNYADHLGYVWVIGQDEPFKLTGERLTALVAYLSSSNRCIDVLAPELEIDERPIPPNVITDASGIRFEV